jgi:class 3 adenylate cyclase/tetratricopeptide (TPR) repeat protein
VRCSRCGHESSAGAKFCGECGAALAPAAAATVGEERKIVSILFCDLVGFTRASEQADPEDVRARIGPYHQTVRRELERHGGTVEKFIGDAVMAVFGAPVAHEDDPERAVRAGLRILEAIGELNERDPELNLQVRIGINTGEAVVLLQARPHEGEALVAGDVVNTAARIQSGAPVNAVAVAEETFRQTERMFAYQALAPIDAKGKAEPIRVYRAVEPRARIGSDRVETATTPFVGREVEKTLLQGLFDRCVRDSTVEVVTLVGEPGVGKSRLCAELSRYIDEREELVRWRQGRCPPYGEGITFWALGELVKSHTGIFESDSPEIAASKLEEMLPDVEERDWLKARLLPLIGLGSGESASREESFHAWRRFLEAIAGDGPAVVVVEDLHWADPALLDFLSYFAEWAEGVPLLLLCTARPELFENRESWGVGTRNAHTINLTRLSEQETGELVQGLLEQTVAAEEVRETILERAGGNPLYAEELVRLVVDRGLGESGDALAFPESVQALIAARLDTLSADRKSLLQDAAVLGKVFWVGALAAMGEVAHAEVEVAVHELSRKELVRPARQSSIEGESELSFWHVLVRDVAYGPIPRATRARKHRAAAAWLESKAGERMGDLADVLAYHHEQALELARAAGDEETAAEALLDARRMFELAGDRAVPLDLSKADHFYRAALALYDEDDPAQAELLVKAAQAISGQSVVQAEEDAGRAAELFRSIGDELGEARALLDLSRYATYRGASADERVLLDEARRLVERHPPGPVRVRYLARKAANEMMGGRASDCVASSDAAIAMANEFGLEQEAARILQYRGIARTELGDLGGLDDLRESIERLRSAPALSTAIGLLNLADVTWLTVGAEEGLELHQQQQRFCVSHGVTGSYWWSKSESTWMLFDLGRWDELLATVEEVKAAGPEAVGLQALELGLPYQALVLARRGELEAAREVAETVLPTARASRDLQLSVPALAAAALVRFDRGDLDGALALMQELSDVLGDASDRYRCLFLAELTRVCALAERVDLAQELGGEPTVDVGRAGAARTTAAATLTETEGRHADALPLYEDAARRWREVAGLPGVAAALLGSARCLIALDRSGVDAPLAEARDLYAAMGDEAGVAETEELRAASCGDGRPAIRRGGSPGVRTRRDDPPRPTPAG